MKNLTGLLFISFCFHIYLMGQHQVSVDDAKACIERYYGTNDLLVNGRTYLPVNTKASGHPYFETADFVKGTIFVKAKAFDNVDLKFNVEKNQLILHHRLTNGIPVQVIVTPALVDSFRINRHLFVNERHITAPEVAKRFFKKIYAGNLGFYRKEIKLFQPVFSRIHPNGKYSDTEISYLLVKDSQLHDIHSKRDFLKCYPGQEREIKQYMKQQSIKFKKASDDQFYNLLKFCDEIIRH